MFEVVSPAGKPTVAEISGKSSSEADLTGKKLGLIQIPFPNGDVLLESLAGLLKQQFKGLEPVKIPSGKRLAWGDYPDNTLTEVAQESGISAALVAVGC